eukprot:TRINITY_DN71874_c0_g1_i1.p2 TRINITY_DN71874_c0_g1~~TRINITY_DN71874_c0_g1_i1.p2  ORF type:complete len:291 (-),score=45.95 TRINITY_DN71874_c0_g1_i1:98-886(-)
MEAEGSAGPRDGEVHGENRASPRPLLAPSALPSELLDGVRACRAAAQEQERALAQNLEAASKVVQEALEAPDARVVRLSCVDGRLICVVDNALPDSNRQKLFEYLERSPFSRTMYAKMADIEHRHYVCRHPVAQLEGSPIMRAGLRLATLFFPDLGPLVCNRAYTNSRFFGDVGFVHRDADTSDTVTALYYPNPEWRPELGGETCFYDERGVVVESVEPKPGRFAIFCGSIQHRGSPPGRLLEGPRFTTAFKLSAANGKSRS